MIAEGTGTLVTTVTSASSFGLLSSKYVEIRPFTASRFAHHHNSCLPDLGVGKCNRLLGTTTFRMCVLPSSVNEVSDEEEEDDRPATIQHYYITVCSILPCTIIVCYHILGTIVPWKKLWRSGDLRCNTVPAKMLFCLWTNSEEAYQVTA